MQVNIESNVKQGIVFLDTFLRVLTAEMQQLRGNQALVMWYACTPASLAQCIADTGRYEAVQ